MGRPDIAIEHLEVALRLVRALVLVRRSIK